MKTLRARHCLKANIIHNVEPLRLTSHWPPQMPSCFLYVEENGEVELPKSTIYTVVSFDIRNTDSDVSKLLCIIMPGYELGYPGICPKDSNSRRYSLNLGLQIRESPEDVSHQFVTRSLTQDEGQTRQF